MNCAELAERITQVLGLSTPPVALTFVDEAPDGISGPPQAAPSACTFWREAERQTFYASAADHANCPVGAMVMGFALPADVAKQLGELVTDMCDCHYLAADEPERIPAVPDQHAGIVYGPLAERTTQPDVALLWASPQQAMLCNEAMGTASWAANGPSVSGRPGCAALPVALAAGQPAISFGCAGMRTFTGVADDLMLIAIPGSALERFAAAIEETSAVNSRMLAFYRGQRAQFPLTAV